LKEDPLPFRRHLSFANVTAALALFVALGGTSYAAIASIPPNSVGTKQLKDSAVTTAKIANGAVTKAKLAKGVVVTPSTFVTTFPQTTISGTLATLRNGIVVQGTCRPGIIVLGLNRKTAGDELQASGTATTSGTIAAVDFDATSGEPVTGNSASSVDIDLLARDATAGGKFARIEVHGTYGSPCTFWGMIIPSG
jgi:hypothetical protein